MKKLLTLLVSLIAINFSNAQTTFILEDFSTAFGTTPPVGWSQTIVTGDTTIDFFHFDNPGGQTLNSPITDPAAIFDSDNYSSGSGAENILLLTYIFDASGANFVKLQWDQYLDASFGGEVFVEAFNGTSWDIVYSANASTPDPDQPLIDISTNVAGVANAQVRFRWTGDWSMFWIIDNVEVFEPAPYSDVGVIAFNIPSFGCGLSAAENIEISVTNFGTTSQNTIPVAYSINGGAVVNDTIFVTLDPGNTTTFVFSTAADVSNPGVYSFDAWTNLAGDADNTNDTANSVVNSLATLASFPYFEDFESGAGGWFSQGELWLPEISTINNSWALGTPAKSTINSAASGVNSWVTGGLTCASPGDCFPPLERSSVISPCFDFTSLASPVIELKIWYEIEFAWDGVVMQSSIDGGSTWQNIGAVGDPFNWYTVDISTYGNTGFDAHGIAEAWTGDNTDFSNGSGGWITARNDLTGLGGQSSVMLRVLFGSDWGYVLDGFAFDDINILDAPAAEMSVVSIVSPTTGCGLTATENVTVLVYNGGSVAQDSFPVSFNDGTGPVTEIFTDTIAPGNTIAYTFTATSDLSALDSFYYFDAWTSLAGDTIGSNDSITNHPVLNPALISSFPYIEDFEAEPLCVTSCGEPCPLTGWWRNSPNDDIDWTVDENGTPTGSSGPLVDYTTGTDTGNYLYTESSGCYGVMAALISPCIDINVLINPKLSFAYHMFGANMGNLLIEVESGGVWTNIGWIEGQQQTSPAEAWKTETISLNSFTGVIRIRFTGITGSDWTSDIAIDDISIFQPPADEVGVIAIDAPVSGCGLTASESVTVRVYNFGSATQTSIPVSYRINAGAPVNDTIADTLNPGETLSYTFSATADLSVPGIYNFDSWTNLAGDTNNSNDSTTNYLVADRHTTDVCIYDVDNGSGEVTCSNFTNNVGVDGYDYGDLTLKSSDPILLNTSLLDSIVYYLYYTSCGGITTNFTFFLNDISIGSYIDATAECSFTPVATYPLIFTITDSAALNGALSCGTNTLSVIHDGGSMVVAGYSAMVYGNCDTITNNVGIIAIDAPTSSCSLTASESITIRVYNFGSATQTSIPVSYSVNGGAPVNQTFADTLNAGDTIALTFTTTADLSAPDSTYVLYAWTSLAGDGCSDNDSAMNVVETSFAVNLGWDTTLCGGTVTLDAGNPGSIYLWSTGDSIQSIVADTTGTYWVDVTNTFGCTESDSINVTINQLPATPLISASGTTTFCQGDSVTLTTDSTTAYLWTNSSTTQGITVTASGNFAVTVGTSGCNSAFSTVTTVNVNSIPVVDLGVDTISCGDSILLDAQNSGNVYSWSTTDSTQTILVGNTGTYWVDVTNIFGCTERDSIDVTINSLPIIVATPDTGFVCGNGDSVSLTASGAVSYTWSPSATLSADTGAVVSAFPTVNTTYMVVGTDVNNCVNSTTVTVQIDTTLPVCLVGISELYDPTNSIKLYPNPTNGIVNIDVNANVNITSISVYNIIGSKVFEVTNSNSSLSKDLYTIDLSNQPNGSYQVRIQTTNGVIIKKINLIY